MTLGPYTLVAELTYACPLRCAYCSNPVDLATIPTALTTTEWLRVLAEAEALGVVQLHLTGGEPLLRSDLEQLIAGARERELFVNLVTSGVPLARERLVRLQSAGLDAVQLSIQGATGANALEIAGIDRHAHKLEVARWVRELDLPLTINCVLHARNIDEVEAIVALAERLDAQRLELANTQYLGWALRNRGALMPSADQLARAREVASAARRRLEGRMQVVFVLPDHHAELPRACMGGWARDYLVVAPDGLALPCHAARELPLVFWNVRDRALDDIWRACPGFTAFRGDDWLPSPCDRCEHRTRDFGGCRCQAFALTGDAAATDPACSRAPRHDLVVVARDRRGAPIQLRDRARNSPSS